MGAAYKLCDCKFNDTRLEENLPLSINQELLKLNNNNSYLSPLDENYSLLEKIKRKNASNLIIKAYRRYRNKSSFDNFSNTNTPRNKTINFEFNNNNNKETLDLEQYDLNNQTSFHLKNNHKKTLVYIGEQKSDVKEGFGIKIMPNNVKYIGFFKNNKSEGYGKFINENKKDIGFEIKKRIDKCSLSSCTRVNYSSSTSVRSDSLFEQIRNTTITFGDDIKT